MIGSVTRSDSVRALSLKRLERRRLPYVYVDAERITTGPIQGDLMPATTAYS